MSDTDIDADDLPDFYDREAIERDIHAGAKACRDLLRNASLDWNHWSATILGLRGLRTLAWDRARTTNMLSQAYRDAMSALLDLKKYAVYNEIDKPTRSDCYRMMDELDNIDAWYANLPTADKLRWKHPSTVAKHCPKEFLKGGMRRHNKPPKATKKPAVSAETERLRALLIEVIKILSKYEPETARTLLDKVMMTEPNDSVADLPGFNAEA